MVRADNIPARYRHVTGTCVSRTWTPSVMRKIPSVTQRCTSLRRNGSPCTAKAGTTGYCIGHAPGAQDARRKGGQATSRAERAGKLLPARLQPMVSLLEDALGEVHRGELDPRAASAMASLAGALVRAMTAGELEERLRALEDRGGGKVSP